MPRLFFVVVFFSVVLFTFFSKTTDVWYKCKVYLGYLLLCINRYEYFFYAATVNRTNLWFSDSSFEMVWTNFEFVINPDVILCDWRDVKNPKLTTPTPPHPLPLPLPTETTSPPHPHLHPATPYGSDHLGSCLGLVQFGWRVTAPERWNLSEMTWLEIALAECCSDEMRTSL